MNKKILIGSIIAVVILVLVSSSSAIDVVKNDNDEIEPEPLNNDYVEIRTYIWGVYTDFIVHSGFIIRNVTITAVVGLDYLEISGRRWEGNRIDYYHYYVEWVRAPLFIGFCHQLFHHSRVRGIAFGDIEYKVDS